MNFPLEKLSKIKILEIIDGGFLGGGQTNVLSIIKNIDKNKFEVHVAAGGSGKFEDAVNKLGITFYPVEMPKFLRTKFLRKIQLLHNKEKYDIIHSHGGVAGFYGRLMKKHNPELRSVHTIHGIHYINLESFFKRNISKTIEQYLVKFTDKTICVSRSDFITAVDIKITDEFKTVVIPNGIDVAKFSVHEKNMKLLNALGLDETNFVIGNISRFDIQKNQMLIIQAAYYLTKKFPEMRFVFVGKGKYLKRMIEYTRESALGKYVIFTGELYDLPEVYSIFDIFVLPSFWEGLPYVLLEAMASKIPVICSNLPGLNEVVTNNFSALTIDPHDMDDLFTRISAFYSNEDLRNKLKTNAYEAVQKYDENRIIKDYEKVYTEVMNI
jgi:glycosyltransferase involved in cell wall biosynthesis